MSEKDPSTYRQLGQLPVDMFYNADKSPVLDTQKLSIADVVKYAEEHPDSPIKGKVLEKLRELKENCLSRIKKLVLTPRKHSVMNHGDLWISNILFHRHGNDVNFVDLQTMKYVYIRYIRLYNPIYSYI